jgi:hypothetical protein
LGLSWSQWSGESQGRLGWNITAVESLNGSFDDGADSETWCDEDGGGYGLFLKPFQGSTNSESSSGQYPQRLVLSEQSMFSWH